MRRSPPHMQRRMDEGTWIPESSRIHIPVNIKSGSCLVGHFGPGLKKFANPEVIGYGPVSLREFVSQKAGLVLRLESGVLVRDTTRVPNVFQGRELPPGEAIEYIRRNKSWATGMLLQDPRIASQLMKHYSQLVSQDA